MHQRAPGEEGRATERRDCKHRTGGAFASGHDNSLGHWRSRCPYPDLIVLSLDVVVDGVERGRLRVAGIRGPGEHPARVAVPSQALLVHPAVQGSRVQLENKPERQGAPYSHTAKTTHIFQLDRAAPFMHRVTVEAEH